MSSSYAKLKEEYKVARRTELIEHAAAALLASGIRSTTMDQIAASAGVSKVVLYRYFGSKDKLVHAILSEVTQAILDADAQEAAWWTERMTRTLQVVRERSSAMRLLVRHSAHDTEFGCHIELLSQGIVRRIEERQAEILGPSETPPGEDHIAAQAITAFLLDSYVRWIESGDPTRDAEFLKWATSSIRAMSYYWWGREP